VRSVVSVRPSVSTVIFEPTSLPFTLTFRAGFVLVAGFGDILSTVRVHELG